MKSKAIKKPLNWVSPIQPLVNEARRQQLRRALVQQAFAELTAEYGGEPRRIRRAMARGLGKNRYKTNFGKKP